MIKVKKFVVNPLRENTFLVYDETGECIIIDAGFYYGEEESEADYFIEKNNLTPVKLVNTHAHFDHIMGIEYFRKKYGLGFYLHEDDLFWVEKAVGQGQMFGFEMEPVANPSFFIVEGEPVKFGNSALQTIHVPGHSPGHVAFYAEKDKKLFAGDVLFYGSIGRADLPGGDYQALIRSIKTKLLGLPAETIVYCGHGPETTIGFEKENNPFLT